MKSIYAPTLIAEANNVIVTALAVSTLADESAKAKLLNAIGSFSAVVNAMIDTSTDNAHIAAAEAYKADELISEGPEGHAVKCANHEWVSINNQYITNVEMCLTCHQNGEGRVPIRIAKGADK